MPGALTMARGGPLALLIIGITACARGGVVTPVYDMSTRELVRLDYDYDANGVVDVRTYMRRGQPVRLEGDVNHDGIVDRWEYYDANGQLERLGASTLLDGREDSWMHTTGDERRLDLSTERDGAVTRREYYRGEALVRTELDTNHDSQPDIWEQYDGGRLTMVLIDADKTHGKPTRRLVYSGATPVVEVDPDGDGQFAPETAAAGLVR